MNAITFGPGDLGKPDDRFRTAVNDAASDMRWSLNDAIAYATSGDAYQSSDEIADAMNLVIGSIISGDYRACQRDQRTEAQDLLRERIDDAVQIITDRYEAWCEVEADRRVRKCIDEMAEASALSRLDEVA